MTRITWHYTGKHSNIDTCYYKYWLIRILCRGRQHIPCTWRWGVIKQHPVDVIKMTGRGRWIWLTTGWKVHFKTTTVGRKRDGRKEEEEEATKRWKEKKKSKGKYKVEQVETNRIRILQEKLHQELLTTSA